MNKQTENKIKKWKKQNTKQCGVCYDDLTVDNCVSTLVSIHFVVNASLNG